MASYRQALENVFHDMLMRYAMMSGEPSGPGSFGYDPELKYINARIEFKGTHSGEMTISTTRDFCVALASNVLGTDISDQEALANEEDAVKEFINLACGHFVTEAFGKNATADLMPPHARAMDAKEWKESVESADISFTVDGMPFTASVAVKNA